MLHFIYTFVVHKPPRDGSGIEKSVCIYRIKRGVPKLVASATDTFVDEMQLVLETMEKHKLLPKKAFARDDKYGNRQYYYSDQLEAAGIATIKRVL